MSSNYSSNSIPSAGRGLSAPSNIAGTNVDSPVTQTSETAIRSMVVMTPASTPLIPVKSHQASSKEEDEEILKEICTINGLNFARVQEGDTSQIHQLEIFFSSYPRVAGLHLFSGLKKLTVMHHPMQCIEGFPFLTNLTELWICECRIKKIENLQAIKYLKKLYLYSNEIKKIENLDHMVDLEILWLCGNQIVNIENLMSLFKLRELNLAENSIEKIGHSLDANIRLLDLNLSGNKISSLKDLTSLMRLPNLSILSLKDPLYSPCPVSLLCNYSTHVLYHLPNLTKLDTYDVSNKSLADMAETTVMKKKMYYNMRIKTVRRNVAEIKSKMDAFKENVLTVYLDRICDLISTVKEIEQELERPVEELEESAETVSTSEHSMDGSEANLQKITSSTPGFPAKLTAIKERIKKWEQKVSEIEAYYQETLELFRQSADALVNRMILELDSGGNIRFEEGSQSDLWFTSCHDLVLSRFCAADYREHEIVGIKIRRIIRVHNRILRSRFDEKLTSIVDDMEGEFYITNRNMSYKKNLEYLFWMWDPELAGGTHAPTRILEEGFMDKDTYRELGRDGAVPMSNSLSLSDRHRMKYAMKQSKGKDACDPCPFRYGQIIISKVYLGKNVKAMDEKLITKSSYPKIDSVYRPRKMCIANETNTKNILGITIDSYTCECSTRQCEWFIFDHELVLPEYIIEFEYLTKVPSPSPFATFSDMLLDSKVSYDLPHPPTVEDKHVDDDVINMEPKARPRPRMISLTDELLKKLSGIEEIEHITTLNLHGNGLTRLKPISELKMLKKLIVSFNELTRLDEIAQMGLEQLDASHNKIISLEGMKGLTKLKFLDISWNRLERTRDELSIMRKHMPNLVSLDVRHNRWQKPENLRLRIIGRLKSLTILNGTQVTEVESSSALRVAAGSRISQLSLISHSRTTHQKPRSLSLMSTAQILCSQNRNRPEKVGEADSSWYSKVTALNLDNQHLTKISNLDKLENLKYASLENNDLTKIEGLENCSRLEELSLENNCITRLDGITRLTQLRRLCLGNNYISSLDGSGLQFLVHLHYLALDNNRLSSVSGLQNLTSLMELYVGNNLILNLRDVFYLKGLSSLVILDMYGNPVTCQNDYRLFVIYHLKTLKALDGSAIDASEGSLAKDTFGGRLTPDFVAEKLGHSNFQEVRELDMPNSSLRIIDLGPGDIFVNLRSVNLEHNNLTSFSGLVNMPNLRVLCLNHNHIECIMPKNTKIQRTIQKGTVTNGIRGNDSYNNDPLVPVLENLEVLHLGYNNIKDMAALQLSRLTSLKALFLQGNEITKVEGLEGLHDLRELVLDRNKIKAISETSFINQWNLQELHLEENRLRDLSNFICLENLQRLYLGSNRIQELSELEKLDGLLNLMEISVVNNGAARRHLHRPILVYRLKTLMVIDGIPVTDDERAKAELYFLDQQQLIACMPSLDLNQPIVVNQGQADGSLPGLGQYKTTVPVKVTNMQLATSPMWNGANYYEDVNSQDIMQKGGGRRRNKDRPENGASTLGRTNTMYNTPSTGYGGFAYTTTTGNRAQFYLNQIPYVGAHNSQPAEYVEWLTRYIATTT
ncbi:hypothetical protein ACJMK2_037491, partial [Sinanodonta woodiana]